MITEKRTLGPWKIQCGKNYSNEIVGKSKTGKDWVIARTTAAKVGRDADDANALLIAAAPDLLATLKRSVVALEECANHLDSYRISQLEETRLVIAKAEGRAK